MAFPNNRSKWVHGTLAKIAGQDFVFRYIYGTANLANPPKQLNLNLPAQERSNIPHDFGGKGLWYWPGDDVAGGGHGHIQGRAMARKNDS